MLHVRIFTNSVSFTDISRFKVEGMRVTLTRGWIYQPCDVAIMYGLANPERRSLQGQLRNSIYREHKGPIVVVESSLLGRGFRPSAPSWVAALRRRPLRPRQVHPYFRVAVGGALGDDADFCSAGSPPDRWETQRRELGLKLAPYRQQGQHVLILGQVGRDASLRGLDIAAWLGETARAVRQRTARPILVRLHPSMRWRDRERALAACAGIDGLSISPIESSFAADVRNAWTCVTYSSGGAVDALLAGVPPICLSPASLAYALCSQSLDDIDAPLEPDRTQFFCDLAYSQWTPAEMSDGTAWRHLLPAVQHKLEASVEARLAQREPGAQLPPARRRALLWRLNAFTWFGQLFPKSPRALQGRAEALAGLGYAAEAKATFEALQERWPRRSQGFRGAAKAAEQLGQWEDALQAWSTMHQLRPDRAGALSGIGRTALRLGRLDLAEPAYRRLVTLTPDRAGGLRGLERIATERGDWAEALVLQLKLWDRFRDLGAVQRYAQLLTRLNHLDKLRCFAQALGEAREPMAYLLAMTPLHSVLHEWQATLDLLRRHPKATRSNWQLLRAEIVALRRLGRVDEALAALEAGHAGSATQRASLQIECLVEARRYPEADRLLQAAWEGGTIEKIGGGNLAAVMTAAQELGGLPLARSVLEGLVPSADRSGRALHFNRLFQRLRLDSLEALAKGRLLAPATSSEQQLLTGLDERGAPREEDLRNLCAMLAGHRAARPDAHFPDASFLLRDALEIALRVVDAADAARPLSLLRLGDGEGAMLPYRPELQPFRSTDLADTSKTWWGGESSPTPQLAAELEAAIRAADIIGIPDLYRAARVFYPAERTSLTNGRNMRGLLAVADFAAANGAGAVWTTCHIHQSLAFWGLWDIILPRLGSVDIITCHGQLGDILSQRHGLEIGQTYRIPPERKYAAAFTGVDAENHFPDVFERLRDVLPAAARGRTVLVSAGMLGKIYCHWIKQAGGVAIDIGSAADHWCGYGTRGIADVAIYRSPIGTAALVRALVASHPRYAGLLLGMQPPRRASGAGA
ncbi:hypothetical protein LJR016_000886 [Devosia sp. LjRoot16]|uniref:tetratricopeptide repeat protein n=1 Tax=Devosia sp. LjRoot16 TaxID=3342271 RepID=UPI003ED068C5